MFLKRAVLLDDDIQIPARVHTLTGFRRWTHSDRFPERGRIDYLRGVVEVDLSPEDLYTHGVVKTAIASELHILISKSDRGSVFVDRTRVVAPAAGLSVEPDVVAVLWESVDAGRVREVPAARSGEGRYIELEGAPDLIVEIISDRSVRKDRERLPRLYAAAGVPELWLVDARGGSLVFEIWTLGPDGYSLQELDADGFVPSPLLGRTFRLLRRLSRPGRWSYELEHAAATPR
jgi:Uma2 family endonuclease